MVLPEIPDDAIETLRQASVVVEYPWDRYTVTMQRLAERIAPVRSLRPPPALWVREHSAFVAPQQPC
jgi:hypothetical protein